MRAPFTLTTTSTTIIITTSLLLSFITAARAEFSCSAVGYFPHPSDCSQFYRCTDIWSTGQYQQYEFQCAEGTVFDVSIREVSRLSKQLILCFIFFNSNSHFTRRRWNFAVSVCNWPQQVAGCGLEAPVGATETPSAPETTPADTTPGTTPGTEIPSVTFRPAAGSPFQCSQPGPVRDEAHCNKFWLCREETEGSGVLEVK